MSYRSLAAGVRRICASSAWALAAALFVSLPMVAQAAGTVTGRVQNASNGTYLNNARVTVQGTNITVFTDEFGEFRIGGLNAGSATINVYFAGLEPQTLNVEVVDGQAVTHNVRMVTLGADAVTEDEVIVLDPFEVAGNRETNAAAIAVQEQRYAESLRNVVAADAFGDVTEGNIGEFMKFLPGVTVDYVAADVRTMAVRGFADNFTSVTVNGSRLASSASGSNTRAFEFEQVSINNVSRVEVTKSPTPSMPADSLGGAVNLVSKNAFERDKAEFKYRLYFSANSEDLDPFVKSAGPMGKSTYKVLPGFDFDYTIPVNENFGVVITGLTSNQFNEQHRSQPTWNFAQAGATVDNPYLQQYQFQDGPKNTFRDSLSLKADWRLRPGEVLSFGWQSNYYKSQFGNRNFTANVGTSATPTGGGTVGLTFGPDFVSGASGRGNYTGGTSFRDKHGQTNAANLNYRLDRGDWEVEAGLAHSRSKTWYRDTGRGHFSAVSTQLIGINRVEMSGFHDDVIETIRLLDAAGNELDPTPLYNYNLTSVRRNPLDARDTFYGGDASLKYKFNLDFPFALKGGVAIRKQERDVRREDESWNYVGPGGNRNAEFAHDTEFHRSPGFGRPVQQYPDPYLIYEDFLANPQNYTQTANQQRDAERFRRQNSYYLEETITSYFLQAEMKLMESKLSILGGVRFEETEDYGEGLATNGPAGTLAEVEANLIERAYKTTQTYDDVYPSVHVTYNLTDNLLARLSYAKTLGRPDFSTILPLVRVNDTDTVFNDGLGNINPETIIVNNTGLKPWTGDSYDLSLEYYFPQGGMLSGGYFYKSLADFWGDVSGPATQEQLDYFGLPSEYLGFDMRTKSNIGDASISGFEFNYQQPLRSFGEWGKNFNIFLNGTMLDLSGPKEADFNKFIEETANWGVTWSPKRWVVSLKWNYRGRQRLAAQGGSAYGSTNGFREYYAPRTYTDLNVEYQISKRFTIFANARNIFNVQQTLQRYNDTSADYAKDYRYEEFGVQIALGVKGTF